MLSCARRDGEGRLLEAAVRCCRASARSSTCVVTRFPSRPTARPTGSWPDRRNSRSIPKPPAPRPAGGIGCTASALTAHDGLVRAEHPLLQQVLRRRHSASSLKLLLRNPQAFVWKYAFHWEAPEVGSEPLVLDALSFGNLVHYTLDLALQQLEAAGGLSAANEATIATAIRHAMHRAAVEWETDESVPRR